MTGDRRTTTLGELIAAHGGSIKTGPFGTVLKANEYTTRGVPLISVGEIGYGVFRIHDKTPRVSPDVTARLPEYVLREGDIVFGRKGAVDRSARVAAHQEGWFLGSDGIRLRLPETTDSRFIGYQLRSEALRKWILQHATGTTMASLNQGVIERIPISLPPLAEQRSVAHVLAVLDAKIDVNRRMSETLESIAQALFKSWFIDFEPVRSRMAGSPVPNMPSETAALFPAALEHNIPSGWQPSSLADVVALGGGEVQTGPFGSQLHASDYVVDGVPVVMPTNIQGRRVTRSGIACVAPSDADRLSRHKLRIGDLVYSRRGDVEKHAIVGPEEQGWLCGTGCLRVRPAREGARGVSPHFLSLWLDQPASRAWIAARAVGATMPNLNTAILGQAPVLLPNVEVLDAFDRILIPIDSRIRQARAEIETVAELRDLLIPKLMSGAIRILDLGQAAEFVS